MLILDDMPVKRKENVRELLQNRANATPEKTFLLSESDGREWTYAEFDRTVNRVANFLRSHGIEKGDVVSLLLPNSAEYIVAYFACWKIGALAGPVNSLLKSEEIAWVVGNSEAKLMLVGSEFVSSLPAETAVTSSSPGEAYRSAPSASIDDRHRSVPPVSAGGAAPDIGSTSFYVESRPPADAGGTDLGRRLTDDIRRHTKNQTSP